MNVVTHSFKERVFKRPSVKIGFKIKLIFNIVDDITLLPQFLSYYSQLGVDEFLINVTDESGDGSILDVCKHFLQHTRHVITNTHSGRARWALQMEMAKRAQRRFCDTKDWILHVGLDEFHEYPAALRDFFTQCDRIGTNLVTGECIDRVSPNGELNRLEPDVPVFEQFPLACQLSQELLQVPRWRTVAARGNVFVSKTFDAEMDPLVQKGIEAGVISVHPAAIQVHHFKWHERMLKAIKQEREEARAAQLIAGHGAKESISDNSRIINYFEKTGDRIDLSSKALDVHHPDARVRSMFPVSDLALTRKKKN